MAQAVLHPLPPDLLTEPAPAEPFNGLADALAQSGGPTTPAPTPPPTGG